MKKIIKIAGVVACATVLFFNVSLNGKNNSNGNSVASLNSANSANAECVWVGWINAEGHCIWTSNICIEGFRPEMELCDWRF